MSQIVTGEAVALDLRVARVGSRSIAKLLDSFIQMVAGFVLVLLFGQLGSIDGAGAQAIFLVLFVGLLLGYPVAFEALWRGRTPGKAAMGLRVVRDDGGPVRFRHALIRGLLGAVVELPGLTLFFGGVLSSLLSERGKRLGDRAAGTIVVQERVPTRAGAAVPMPAPLASWAATLDLSRVSNELALGIRQFFERSTELSPQAREQLGYSLTTAVVAVIAPAPPPGAPGWAILAAVLAERRRRDEQRFHQQRQAGISAGAGPPAGTWQGPGQPGWQAAPPVPQWQASAPTTGSPPAVGPGPVVPAAPYYASSPAMPPAPAPVPAPPPVPASEPPATGTFHLPS